MSFPPNAAYGFPLVLAPCCVCKQRFERKCGGPNLFNRIACDPCWGGLTTEEREALKLLHEVHEQ